MEICGRHDLMDESVGMVVGSLFQTVVCCQGSSKPGSHGDHWMAGLLPWQQKSVDPVTVQTLILCQQVKGEIDLLQPRFYYLTKTQT